MSEQVSTYKIITLGSSLQELKGDIGGFINRPMVCGEGDVKKWGDEYIIFNNTSLDFNESPNERVFLGSISLNRKYKKYLKLFKEIDIPLEHIDYYIYVLNTPSVEKVNKIQSFVKANKESYSCILSNAYHRQENGYKNQMILIVKHGDRLVIDNKDYIFDEHLMDFVFSA